MTFSNDFSLGRIELNKSKNGSFKPYLISIQDNSQQTSNLFMNHCLTKEFPLKGNHRTYAAGGSFPEIYPSESLEENSESCSEKKHQVNTWVDLPDFL